MQFNTSQTPQEPSDKSGIWQFQGFYPYQCRVKNACEKDLLWFEPEHQNSSFDTYQMFQQRKGFCSEEDLKKQPIGYSFFSDNKMYQGNQASQPIWQTEQQYQQLFGGDVMAIKENDLDCF